MKFKFTIVRTLIEYADVITEAADHNEAERIAGMAVGCLEGNAKIVVGDKPLEFKTEQRKITYRGLHETGDN